MARNNQTSDGACSGVASRTRLTSGGPSFVRDLRSLADVHVEGHRAVVPVDESARLHRSRRVRRSARHRALHAGADEHQHAAPRRLEVERRQCRRQGHRDRCAAHERSSRAGCCSSSRWPTAARSCRPSRRPTPSRGRNESADVESPRRRSRRWRPPCSGSAPRPRRRTRRRRI